MTNLEIIAREIREQLAEVEIEMAEAREKLVELEAEIEGKSHATENPIAHPSRHGESRNRRGRSSEN